MAATTAGVLTAVSIAATAGGAGMSFSQAMKQNKAAKAADKAAKEAMEEARKRLDVNVYESLSLQKEPYELAREALIAQGAQALQAGVEGDLRGVAATAGRVQAAAVEGQAGVRSSMGRELASLEKLTADEEKRLLDEQQRMYLNEVQGAQQARADAEAMKNQAIKQGMTQVAATAGQLAELPQLYEKTESAKAFQGALRDYAKANNLTNEAALTQFQTQLGGMNSYGGVDLTKVGNMSADEFQAFITTLPADVISGIFTSLNTPDTTQSSTGNYVNTENIPGWGEIVNPFNVN